MQSFTKNWKTTAAGVGGFLVALGTLLTTACQGDFSQVAPMLAAIAASVGLIFAKDHQN